MRREYIAWFDMPTNGKPHGQSVMPGQELIRCKDCLYWQDNNGGYPHEDCKWKGDETPDDDDFCSGAEGKG